uniref:Uncharacterized protein n=1 Tax=Arundo donax TaxID=35708 RepID=A0A0A9GJW1_ARUDO
MSAHFSVKHTFLNYFRNIPCMFMSCSPLHPLLSHSLTNTDRGHDTRSMSIPLFPISLAANALCRFAPFFLKVS